jgi:hypothetical protein
LIDIKLTLNAKKSVCYYFNADLYSKGSLCDVGVFKRNISEHNNKLLCALLVIGLEINHYNGKIEVDVSTIL